MLEDIRIRGLGVIDDAVVEPAAGLTVVTGETGAGKTMVVQGLALLFGGRAEASRLRPGGGAIVEGRLRLTPDHPAVVRACDAGADLDEGALLLSRSVAPDGRSRAQVGGRSVPVGVLAELGEHLLALHGQSDQQRLLRPAEQRAALDRYAGEPVLTLHGRYRSVWTRWRDVHARRVELTAAAAERSRDGELLRLGLTEFEATAPLPLETATLAAQIERLANADDLRTAAARAQAALTGDEAGGPDALGLVTTARRALEAAAGHDPGLLALCARVTEVGHLMADAAAELASYSASVDIDPRQLSAAQERLAVLTALVRRLGVPDLEAARGWATSAAARLANVEGTEELLAALGVEQNELQAELIELAGALSAARSDAAARFGEAVTAELTALAMPHAQVRAEVSQRPEPAGLPVAGRLVAAGPDGVDEVQLLLVPHPGAPPRPLHKGASGGELSRLMLAVEVVFAGADPVPLMIFDEVDAGVGGAAAVEVGRRLALLARDHQVIVVTHLPQVAAFADRHLVVRKSDDGAVTRSGVVALTGEDRVAELSRMLAGLDSGLGRAHAQELLAAAGTRTP